MRKGEKSKMSFELDDLKNVKNVKNEARETKEIEKIEENIERQEIPAERKLAVFCEKERIDLIAQPVFVQSRDTGLFSISVQLVAKYRM